MGRRQGIRTLQKRNSTEDAATSIQRMARGRFARIKVASAQAKAEADAAGTAAIAEVIEQKSDGRIVL